MNSEEKLREIIGNWKEEAGIKPYDETSVIHICGDILYFITKRPGPLIGVYGSRSAKYKEILKENGFPSDVRFIEAAYGNLRIF